MKRIMIAAVMAAAMVAVSGVTLFTRQSQTPTAANDFTAIEEQLNELEDYMSLENLDSDFGIEDIAGNWE